MIKIKKFSVLENFRQKIAPVDNFIGLYLDKLKKTCRFVIVSLNLYVGCFKSCCFNSLLKTYISLEYRMI